jgi:glycosyltransferase involved in cell wall biosynthesis
MEKIIFNISSFNRPNSLIKSIESIYNQCDIINVFLNNYEDIPVELYDSKINLFITDNEFGDAYKFFELENSNGYFFTADDDLIYSENYVSTMIENIEKHNRKKIITVHGRFYDKFPINSYYNDVTKVYHFGENLAHDVLVNFGGTGVMAFHTDLFKIKKDYFEYPNMADVWIGTLAKNLNIPILCIKHSENFVKQQEIKESIYTKHAKSDLLQTKITNRTFETKNVSIIVPTYGTPQYLKECIESIYNSIKKQDKVEILIGIDNCSETMKSLNELKIDYRTKVYFFEKNLGPYVVKNTLTKIANSEYIIFFDSDDIMIDGMVESVLDHLKHCNIVKPNFKNFSEVFDINKINKKNSGLWGEGVFGIRKNDFLTLNGFENWRCAADTDFMFRAERYGFKIKRSDNLMFFRRLHKQGLTSAKDTGHNSNLRNYYSKLIRDRKNFNPLPNLFVSEVSLVNAGSENKSLYGVDQNIDYIEIEKHNEILRQLDEKKGKFNVVTKIMSSEKIEPRHKVNNKIKYDVVNNVTQHRLNQKSQYLKAMMKTNLITKRHFNQPR